MRTILIFFKTTPSIIGNWATIVHKNLYYEIYIDEKQIQFVDNFGVPSNKYLYYFNKNKIKYPSNFYYIKYIDKRNMIFYNNKDTLLLQRINVNKYNLDVFLKRKYKFLVTNNIISKDSVNNEINKIKNYNINENRKIKEEQLNYLLNKNDTLKK